MNEHDIGLSLHQFDARLNVPGNVCIYIYIYIYIYSIIPSCNISFMRTQFMSMTFSRPNFPMVPSTSRHKGRMFRNKCALLKYMLTICIRFILTNCHYYCKLLHHHAASGAVATLLSRPHLPGKQLFGVYILQEQKFPAGRKSVRHTNAPSNNLEKNTNVPLYMGVAVRLSGSYPAE